MLMMGFKGLSTPPHSIAKAILGNYLGGVILFDYDFETQTYDRNIQNPQQLKALNQELQNSSQKNNTNKQIFHLPLLIGIDYEGGKVNRLKEEKGFIKTLSAAELGASSQQVLNEQATQMAKTLAEEGFNLNFAPVVDLSINPENPIITKLDRSFSSDPYRVSNYARLFAQAQKEQGIISVYKHFPGHGSSMEDSHHGFVDVTMTWKEEELLPYKNIPTHTAVMTSHVVHYGLDPHGYPASLSLAMTTQLLREQFQFDGVVITDDLQMDAIAKNYSLSEVVRLAINAGADILVFGNQLTFEPIDPIDVIELIYEEVKAGQISEYRIQESFERIQRLKKTLA